MDTYFLHSRKYLPTKPQLPKLVESEFFHLASVKAIQVLFWGLCAPGLWMWDLKYKLSWILHLHLDQVVRNPMVMVCHSWRNR
jgi:hypothetical protein